MTDTSIHPSSSVKGTPIVICTDGGTQLCNSQRTCHSNAVVAVHMCVVFFFFLCQMSCVSFHVIFICTSHARCSQMKAKVLLIIIISY